MPSRTAPSPDAGNRASAAPGAARSTGDTSASRATSDTGATASATGSTDLNDPGLHEAVEHLGGALANAGLARLPARVFAALLATPDGRLTSAELSTLLEVSPAGVSGAVRYLTQLRMIRRERERGSRRDVYVVMDDAWHDMLMQYDQIYAPILAALAVARSAVGEDSRAGARMGLSIEFLEFVLGEMGGITARWEEHKAARG